MKRPWRVVHNSPNKRVLIRPRNRSRKIIHAAPPATDWSWLGDVWNVLLPVFVIVLVLCIIVAYWEIILWGAVIIGILYFIAHNR